MRTTGTLTSLGHTVGTTIIKMVAVLALVAGATVVVTAPAHAAALLEAEPNGNTSTATSLPLGTVIQGTTSTKQVEHCCTYWEDDDYYAIDLPSNGRIKLTLTFPTIYGDGDAYDVYVLDASSQEVTEYDLDVTESNGSWLSKQALYLPKGRSFIEIVGYSTDDTWGKTYKLRADFTPGLVETEPNGSIASADTLPLGRTISGTATTFEDEHCCTYWEDDDYYAIDLPSNGRIKLTLTFPTIYGDGDAYDVYVLDASSQEVTEYDLDVTESNGSWLSKQALYLPKGRSFIEIVGYSTDDTWGKTYKLRADFTPGLVETEPNGSIASADTLPLGRTISGTATTFEDEHCCTYWEDDDYYAFDTARRAKVNVALSAPRVSGSDDGYELTVLNSAGSTIWSSDIPASRGGKSVNVTVPAGRSFVEVTSYSDSPMWGKRYTLRVGYFLTSSTPAITGTKAVGNTLTARHGTWTSGTKFSYHWYAAGKAIAKATKATFKLTKAQAGKAITVKVTGKKTGYATVTRVSKATAKVLTAAKPTLTGTKAVGNTLTARHGTWTSGTKFSYHWYAAGKAIAKATKATFKLTKAQAGKAITVKVTGKKTGYATVTRTSKATAKVTR